MAQNQSELIERHQRTRCYGCHRSISRCFCSLIPVINNQTEVLILQHKRERFHPFNTARILRRSLSNSLLLVDHIDRLESSLAAMTLSDHVGLLYPGTDSKLLDELTVEQRPNQLVILDGTWHHTKTLVRDIPLLQRLPRYRLAPSQPSRYRIRREPNIMFLSTLEATVSALRCLEPDTLGFDKLLQAFDGMVEGQLTYPKSVNVWRKNRRRTPTSVHVPGVLREHLENVVAVYGEMAPAAGHDGSDIPSISSQKDTPRPPVFWVAERLATGERFERAIESESILPASFFRHLELPESAFENACSMDLFIQDWNAFLRPDDTLTFYCSHIPKLLREIGGPERPSLYLKGIQFDKTQKNGTLEQLLKSLGITPDTAHCPGRAGKRLANTIALANYLSALGKS